MLKNYAHVPTEDPEDRIYLQKQLIRIRKDLDSISLYLMITFIFCMLIVLGVLVGGYIMWSHYDRNGWYSNSGRRTDLNGDGFIKGRLTTTDFNSQTGEFMTLNVSQSGIVNNLTTTNLNSQSGNINNLTTANLNSQSGNIDDLITTTLNSQSGDFVTLNVTQSGNIVGTLRVLGNVTFDGSLNIGGNIIVNGTSRFVGNMTVTDTLNVGKEINILTSKLTMSDKSVIEDNFITSGLGSFNAAWKPIRFGNTDYHDLMMFSSKALFMWETNPAGFPSVAYPLGGSSAISMTLATGGLLVNNAISAGGTQVGSSRQIKENIVDYPVDEAMTKMMAIRVRKYNHKQWYLDYTKKENKTVGGFIAEEIRDEVDSSMTQEIFTDNQNLINGTLVTMRKEDLHPIEIKVIQTLVNENAELKSRVILLESLFAQLNASIHN
jgi:hypothetical protein